VPRFRYIFLLLTILPIVGCATVQGGPGGDEHDPLEHLNRSIYQFNSDFDTVILRPVAEGYQKYVPRPVNDSVSNFFGNLDDFITLINDLLQFKFAQAAADSSRLFWNTTIGVLGLFDVASHMDLPKHNEDFGQTFGYWGIDPGPYLVLPFLGPSNLRDGAGLLTSANWRIHPLYWIDDDSLFWSAVALRGVDLRAGLLRTTRVLDQVAVDEYVFVREAYLQQRQNLIYDGNPPMPEFEMFEDELPPEEPKGLK
jgi:phospholipid-binding lipoprotein MlaA